MTHIGEDAQDASDTEADRTVPPLPEIAVSPGQLDFGIVPVGEKKLLQLELTNLGDADLVISKVYLGEESSSFLSIEQAPPDGVGVWHYDKVTVFVSFAPTEYFPPSADPIGRLMIESNDADEQVVEIPVHGLTASGFMVVAPPEVVDFGEVVLGLTVKQAVLVQNVGEAPLSMLGAEFPENSPLEEFEMVEDPGFPPSAGYYGAVLEPKASAELTVTFTNLEGLSGTAAGLLKLVSNDPVTPVVELALKATRNGIGECTLMFDPPSISFGTIAFMEEKTETIHLVSKGTAPCFYKSAAAMECNGIPGWYPCMEGSPEAAVFPITSEPKEGQEMPPGSAWPLEITFKPALTSSQVWWLLSDGFHGRLEVTYEEPYTDAGTMQAHTFTSVNNQGQLTWNISGNANKPTIVLNSSGVDFGPTTLGCHSKTACVEIANKGGYTLDWTDLVSGGCSGEFQLKSSPPLPLALEPDDMAEVCIVYVPLDEGEDGCELTFHTSDPAMPEAAIPLVGSGTWDTSLTEIFWDEGSPNPGLQYCLAGYPAEDGDMCQVWVKKDSIWIECTDGWFYYNPDNCIYFDKGHPCAPESGEYVKVTYQLPCYPE